jgi:uncharacterized protein (DUF302 family)
LLFIEILSTCLFLRKMKTKYILMIALWIGIAFSCFTQNMTVYRSDVSVEKTTEVLMSILKEKDLKFFETVPHHEIAKERDTDISPTNVIIFEDAALSSKLITCEQTSALDLPLKIMVWEEHGDVYIGYFDPILMRRKYLIDGCDDTLKQMSGMMSRLVNECLKRS